MSSKFCINHPDRKIFAHKRCIYCYRKEILYPKQQAKPKKVYRIKSYSDKRIKINSTYEKKKEEKNKELIQQGKFVDFFSNDPFPKDYKPEYHHTIGRDGDLLTDTDYMFPCYRNTHRAYHDLKHEKRYLNNVPWYWSWLERMKTEIPIIYHLEMKKIDKANYGKKVSSD